MSSTTPDDTDADDPRTEIHPEYDHPTPQNVDEWTEDQLDRYNSLTEKLTEENIREEAGELSDEAERALDALEDPYAERTTEVSLPGVEGVEVTVLTHTTEEIEDKMASIDENWNESRRDLEAVRGHIMDVVVYFIESPPYGVNSEADEATQADQEETAREVWREYARRYGLGKLAEVLFTVAEPALDEMQDQQAVQKFRSA